MLSWRTIQRLEDASAAMLPRGPVVVGVGCVRAKGVECQVDGAILGES